MMMLQFKQGSGNRVLIHRDNDLLIIETSLANGVWTNVKLTVKEATELKGFLESQGF